LTPAEALAFHRVEVNAMTLRSLRCRLARLTGLTSLLLIATACGGSSAEGPPPDDPTQGGGATKPAITPEATPDVKAGTATPPDTKSASPAPATDKTAAGKPAHDADGADGVRRWASWDGPKKGTAITTKKAWVFAPNLSAAGSEKESFGAVALTLVTVTKADADEVMFEHRGKKYAVPAALARPAEARAGVKKGSAARCSFGGSSIVGRIEAADAKGVTCAFRFMDKTKTEKLTPEEVFALDGKVDMGASALVRFESDPDAWYEGLVVAASGEDAWVSVSTQFSMQGDPRADRSVHKVKAANVMPIDMSRPLKVGDACLATSIARISPCKVTKVIDGGLAYEVSFADGGSGIKKEWALGEVAPAPKEAAKKTAEAK
jgi:hypothetical protein